MLVIRVGLKFSEDVLSIPDQTQFCKVGLNIFKSFEKNKRDYSVVSFYKEDKFIAPELVF